MKKIYLFLAGIIVLFLAGSVSAALCKTDSGYYEDCNKISSNSNSNSKSNNAPFNHRYQGPEGKSSVSVYLENKSNLYNSNSNSYNSNGNSYSNSYSSNSNSDSGIIPIFKGPYGNYRYKKYESGDYSPPIYLGGPGSSYYNYPYGYSGYSGYGYYPYYGFYGSYPYSGFYGGYYNYYSPYSYYGYSRSYSPVYYSVPYFNIWV